MHCNALRFLRILNLAIKPNHGGNDMRCNDNDHTLEDGACTVCGARWVCHEQGRRHRIVRTRWNRDDSDTCTDCGVEIFQPFRDSWRAALRAVGRPFGYESNRLSVWVYTSAGEYAATDITYPTLIDDIFHHRDCRCGDC